MPIVTMPDGTQVEMPEDIGPELGQRLRAFNDSMAKTTPVEPQEFTPEMLSAHKPVQSPVEIERKRVADLLAQRRSERAAAGRGEWGGARDIAETGALSVIGGGLSLAQIPEALRTVKEAVPRKILRSLFGEQGAEVWKEIQPKLPEIMGGPSPADKIQDFLRSKGVDTAKATVAAKEFVAEAQPPRVSPIVKDQATGEQSLNPDAFKDPKFWVNLVGEEAAPMVVNALFASQTGGAAALNPTILAKLEKAGKIGKLAIKALSSKGAQAVTGFEAARILPSTIEDAKKKYLAAGMSEDEATESAATWGTISAAAQGAVGGQMEYRVIANALEKKAVGLLPKIAGYLGAAGMEAAQEGAQSIAESAIAKMSYDPKLTLADALRSAVIEAAGGAALGGVMRSVTRGIRNRGEAGPTPEYDAPIQAPPEVQAAAGPTSIEDDTASKIRLANELGATKTINALAPEGEPLPRIELDPERRYGKLDLDIPEIASDVLASNEPLGPVAPAVSPETRDLRRADIETGLVEQGESIEAMLAQRDQLTQDVAEAEIALTAARRRRGPKGSDRAQANLDNARASLAEVEDRIAQNTGKWENTKAAWEALKVELAKPGGERGTLGAQENPEIFARTAGLVKAAIQDGYANASEWLSDMRQKMGAEFEAFYRQIGGLEGANRLWAEQAVTRGEEGGLTPQGSGTALLSNEELKRAERGDTYYRVDRSGRVTYLGPQPDATVRNGEAIIMVSGQTGQPQVQNSEGLGSDSAVLSRFAPKVMQAHGLKGEIADSLGLQQMYEVGMVKAKSALGLQPTATDGEVVRAVSEKIGKLGKTVKETTVRIMTKVRGIARDLATAIAEHLHKAVSGTREAQKGALGPDINQTKRMEIKTRMPDDNQSPARAEAYASMDNVVIEPMVDEAFAASRKIREEYWNIPGLKNVVPARWVFSPAVIAMRDNVLQNANRVFSRSVAAKENVVYSFAETIAEWKSFQKKDPKQSKILSAMLTYGTLASGMKGKTWNEAEAQKYFPGVNGETMDLYKKIRSHMDSVTETLIETERERMEKLIRTAEGKPGSAEIIKKLRDAFKANISALRNEAYFPLMRFGDYQITLTDKDGERVGMAFIEKDDAASINKALQDIAAQDPKIREMLKSPDFDRESQIDGPKVLPTIQDIKMNLLSEIPASTIEYLTAMKDLDPNMLSAIELALISNTDFRKRLQHRQGLPGFTMDGLRVYQSYANSVANRISRNKYGLEMDEAVKSLGQKARGKDYDPQIEAEGMAILDSIKSPAYHPVASRLNSISFIWDLGFRVAAGAVNLTQQGVMGLPVLGNFYGSKAATKAMMTGNRVASHFTRLSQLVGGVETYNKTELDALIKKYITPDRFAAYNDPKGLSALVGAVLRDAARDGELRPKAAMDILGMVETDPEAVKSFLGEFGNGIEAIAEFSGFAMSKSEQHNRITTLIASTILAHQKGMVRMDQNGWKLQPIKLDSINEDGSANILTADEKQEAIVETREFAEFMNRIINFSGGRGNLAPYQRVKGKAGGALMVSMQYKRFLLDQITVLHQLGVLNARNKKDKGFARKTYEYAKPALRSYAVTALLGGVSALPLLVALKAIIKAFLPEQYDEFMREVREWHTAKIAEAMEKMGFDRDENMAKKLSYSVEHGLPNATPEGMGADLNPAMTPQLVLTPEGASTKESFGSLVAGSTVGKLASAWDALIDTGGPTSPEAWQKAGEKLLPRARGVGRAVKASANSIMDIINGGQGKLSVTRKIGGEEVALSKGEAILDVLGFNPTRIARWQAAQTSSFERLRIRKQFEAKLKAMVENERSDEARDAAIAWKEKWPNNKEMWVNVNSILRAPVRREKYTEKAREEAGVERVK